MIVPRNRLLWLVGLTVPPMALAAAAFPEAEPWVWGMLGTLVCLALPDAWLAVSRCRSLKVKLPERVSLIRDKADGLKVEVWDEAGRAWPVLVGLCLPAEVSAGIGELRAVLPGKEGRLRFDWPVTGLQRGEYLLTECRLRTGSPLGFWYAQSGRPAETRIRVYPNLFGDDLRQAASFLMRGGAGIHALRQVGRGRDFDKLRDYVPGDSMSDIHWRVTAKRGRLVTKEYQIERTQEIYVVIDASRLSARPVDMRDERSPRAEGERQCRQEPLLERYIQAALTLGSVALRQGDKLGLIAFHHRIAGFVRAGGGRGHYRLCRDALFDLQPQTVTPDFEELASFVLLNLRRRALLLFLTNLDDPALAESFVHDMEAVSRRHLVLVNMVRPEAAAPLFASTDVEEAADIYRCLGGHLLWHGLRELEMVLRRRGIGFSLVSHENLCAEMITRYISVKRRQIL